MEITTEQILKLADIAGDTGRKELEKMFPDVFKFELDRNKTYILKRYRRYYKIICANYELYYLVPIWGTNHCDISYPSVESVYRDVKTEVLIFDTFKEYVEFLNTLV